MPAIERTVDLISAEILSVETALVSCQENTKEYLDLEIRLEALERELDKVESH